MGRYELVGYDRNLKETIIKTKTKKKLTILEADKFTTLFQDTNDLTYYLYNKGYLNDLLISHYLLQYKYNKTNKYFDVLYNKDKEIIKATNKNNKLFKYLIINLLKNISSNIPEMAHNNSYINDYIYNKIEEYRILSKVGSLNETKKIVNDIERELLKEYLQIRKLYIFTNLYKENNKQIKIIGESTDPYIQYLIEKANRGDRKAYEELKDMDLEKTLNLIL